MCHFLLISKKLFFLIKGNNIKEKKSLTENNDNLARNAN